MSNGNGRSLGFALVAALFLIVVLAALGLFALKLSGAQQQSINLTILGTRAQAAANAGIEYAAHITLSTDACPISPINLNQAALSGFTIQVTCLRTTPLVLGSPPLVCPGGNCSVFELTATATTGTYGRPDYASRFASRTVSTVPVP
jgi:MSHA biogenesis protein MshP